MKICCCFILSLCFHFAYSQVPAADTSFTVHSAWVKEVKKYPFITVATVDLSAGIAVQKNVVYQTLNNRQLHADIYYPAKKIKGGHPAVVLIHGGGWRSGNRTMEAPMAAKLAAAGYVAVTVEYRLSTEATFPAGVNDVRNAIKWVRKNARRFNIDTHKIAVGGTSAGGQMAALIGATNSTDGDTSSNVQAVVDIDGILAFKHPESAEGVSAALWLGGTYDEKPDVWKDASALHHVSSTAVPVLFINSSLPRFHAGRTDMISKLDSLGIYSEVHTIPGTPHPFWLFHPWFEPTTQLVIKFLNRIFSKPE